MPNPSVTDFLTTLSTRDAIAAPINAGIICGGLTGYFRYAQPSFTGVNNASANDPGGLFGWLLYSRVYKRPTPAGTTADTYITYDNTNSLIADMNRLGGVTYCLVSTPGQGGTYGFFLNTSGEISGQTFSRDFFDVLHCLSYGVTVVLAGSSAGLKNYDLSYPNNKINVLVGNTANDEILDYLVEKPYVMGFFPSGRDSSNQIGGGYTMQSFQTFVGSTLAASGTSFSNRIFNICGVKTIYNEAKLDQLVSGSKMTTYYNTATVDAVGFYQIASDTNTLYNSIAGQNIGVPLNGKIINSIEWTDTNTKTLLRNNRVNYFVNSYNNFLGQDLVGSTANSNTPTPTERIGVSALQIQIEKDVSDIGLQYLFTVNNAITRSQVITEVQSYLNKLSNFIDLTGTQVICSEANGNIDNTSTLYITVIVKPIVSSSSFVVNIQVTA